MEESNQVNQQIEKQPNIEEQPPNYNEKPTQGYEVRLIVLHIKGSSGYIFVFKTIKFLFCTLEKRSLAKSRHLYT